MIRAGGSLILPVREAPAALVLVAIVACFFACPAFATDLSEGVRLGLAARHISKVAFPHALDEAGGRMECGEQEFCDEHGSDHTPPSARRNSRMETPHASL